MWRSSRMSLPLAIEIRLDGIHPHSSNDPNLGLMVALAKTQMCQLLDLIVQCGGIVRQMWKRSEATTSIGLVSFTDWIVASAVGGGRVADAVAVGVKPEKGGCVE